MLPEMLGTQAEGSGIRMALATAIVTIVVALIMAAGLLEVGASPWVTVPAAFGLGWTVYRWTTRPLRLPSQRNPSHTTRGHKHGCV